MRMCYNGLNLIVCRSWRLILSINTDTKLVGLLGYPLARVFDTLTNKK